MSSPKKGRSAPATASTPQPETPPQPDKLERMVRELEASRPPTPAPEEPTPAPEQPAKTPRKARRKAPGKSVRSAPPPKEVGTYTHDTLERYVDDWCLAIKERGQRVAYPAVIGPSGTGKTEIIQGCLTKHFGPEGKGWIYCGPTTQPAPASENACSVAHTGVAHSAWPWTSGRAAT